MKVRRIILDEDYPILRKWWERRGTEAPPQALLPWVGVLAEMEGGPIACAFLYEDKGGAVAMVEWEATNPVCASPITALRGLNLVFDFFEKYCKSKGIRTVLSWVAEGRGDGRLLERRGWMACPGERHQLMAFAAQGELCRL